MHFYIKLVTYSVCESEITFKYICGSLLVRLREILVERKLEWTLRGLAGPTCRSHSTCL